MNLFPIVSVVMITFDHENYIEQAIKGVLMQKCNFEIELIIANDCSPDRTDSVIQSILDNHPRASCVKYIKHDKNLGMMDNLIFAYKQCRGKYIALCEGDDYWSDSLKLQKQVDFLEVNEEFVMSCSNSLVVNSSSSFVKIFNENEIPEITDVNYILMNNWYIPTASVVFRKNNLQLPNWYYKVQNGDYMLYLILTSNGGLIHYKNEVRCSYRLHVKGASNIFKKKNIFNYSMLYNNKMFNIHSKGKYYSLIKINVEQYSLNILEQLPFLSREFWKVIFNLIWYNKTLNKKIFFFFSKRIGIKIKSLKYYAKTFHHHH